MTTDVTNLLDAVEDAEPIEGARVDLTPYVALVRRSLDAGNAAKGLTFRGENAEKEASVTASRLRSAADKADCGVKVRTYPQADGSVKLVWQTGDRRSYTITPEALKARTEKAAKTRAAKQAAASAPPAGSRPAKRAAK